jgi:hypothetical protein
MKGMLLKISVWMLTLLLFWGNVGIPIFKHTCEKDGVFTSFFFPKDDHCSDNEKELVPSCCSVSACHDNEPILEKEDCCHDDLIVVQFQPDGASNVTFNWQLSDLFELTSPRFTFDFTPINFSENHLLSASTSDPPPKVSGKSLLIQYQVFRV